MCEPTSPRYATITCGNCIQMQKKEKYVFHLLALAVQLGKEFERTAWYRAEEIKKTLQKTSYGQKQTEE